MLLLYSKSAISTRDTSISGAADFFVIKLQYSSRPATPVQCSVVTRQVDVSFEAGS